MPAEHLKAREVLKVKGDILFTIRPTDSLAAALEFMQQEDIGSLVVMEFGEVVGMLTFREVIRAIAQITTQASAQGKELAQELTATSVRKFMDAHPMTVTPDTDLNELRRMMIEHHCRYLPVVEAKKLLGVISFYDVARAVLETQAIENKLLKAYIRDWPQAQ